MTNKYRVFVPGAWDLFHIGHLNLLKRARKIAKTLIVGVDTDASIKMRKGKSPIIPFAERVAILKACAYVDDIFRNRSGSLNASLLTMLDIDIVILADCWLNKDLIGKNEVEDAGIRIQYFPYTKGVSSTMIKNKIRGGTK